MKLQLWKLKSKINWIELGDANTKFFHSFASTCRNFNAIWALQNENGLLLNEESQMRSLGEKHFSEMFKDDGGTNIGDQLKVIKLFPSFISKEDAIVFTSEVTLVEVEGALKGFKRDKSPDPDGWPIEFFLWFFDLVGKDLLGAVELSRK